MDTSPASNPFTGLKGALAGLMSGGWMGLLLGLLFRRRIAPMLAALESLFAQWKAGTLPIPAGPALVRRTVRPRAAGSPAVRGGRRRARFASRRRPVPRAVGPRRGAWHGADVPLAAALIPRAPRPLLRRGRCTENCDGKARIRTP
jgi:hypothetical protein